LNADWRVSKILLAGSYTYVNQMNLNGKLRKKLGGPNREPSKNLGVPWPPLRIATALRDARGAGALLPLFFQEGGNGYGANFISQYYREFHG